MFYFEYATENELRERKKAITLKILKIVKYEYVMLQS